MKRIINNRTKIEAVVFALLLICIYVSSVSSVTREISDTEDNITIFIYNSNGKYWEATGDNIQYAIWDLNGTGGIVYLPSENMSLTQSLRFDDTTRSVTLQGTSTGTYTSGTKLYLASGSNCHMITFTSSVGIYWYNTIKNIQFDGNKAGNVGAYDIIHITSGHFVTVQDCTITNAGQYGYWESGLEVFWVKNCVFTGSVSGAIRLIGAATGSITECDMYGNGGIAIELRGSCSDVTIMNNHISGDYGSASPTSSDGISMYSGVYLTKIIGNSISWNRGHGIKMNTDCNNNTITSNIIESNGKNSGSGIYIMDDGADATSCKNNIISSNWIGDTNTTKTQNYGIYISYAENTSLSNNIFGDNKIQNIYFVNIDTVISSNALDSMVIKNSNGNLFPATGAGLQAAIYNLNGSGGNVYIPVGTITLSKTIWMTNNTNLVGSGWNTILKFKEVAGEAFFGISNYKYDPTGVMWGAVTWNKPGKQDHNITIRDLQLDGTRKSQGGAASQYGIFFRHANNTRVINCYVHDVVRLGVGTAYDCFGFIVRDCYITRCNTSAINYGGAPGSIITNNRIESTTEGIYPEYENNNSIISGNVITKTTGDSIWVPDNDNHGILVENNIVYNFAGSGIYVDNDNCSIIGNIVNTTNLGVGDGIVQCHNCTIIGNKISGLYKGIYVYDSNILIGNSIRNCVVPVTVTSNNLILDNWGYLTTVSTVNITKGSIQAGFEWYDLTTHTKYMYEGAGVWKSSTFT